MDVNAAVTKLLSGNVLTTLIQFGAFVGFTQALGAGAVGSYVVFQALIGMVGLPINLGISRAAEKHLSADEPAGEVMTTAALVKGLLILPWIGALVLAGPHVESYVGIEGILPFVIAGLVANQAQLLSLRLLAGQLRVGQNALLRVIGRAVWLVGGFALIDAGWGATAIIAAFVVGDLVTMLGALVRLDLALGWPNRRRARELLDFGRYVFIGDVGGFLYQWMDVAILRLFVGTDLIGAYEIAWRVASVSMMVTKAIRTSLFPQISSWYAENRYGEIETALSKWLQVPLYLTIPAFAGGVVIGEDVLGVLFGAEVTVAYPVLVVFLLEKILRSVQLVVGPSLFAMDQPQLGYRGPAAAIAVNLVLNVTLIPLFGLLGAAVATTLSAASAAVVAIYYVSRFVTLRVPWPRVAWTAIASAIMGGGVFLLRRSLPAGPERIAVCVGAGVAIYVLLLLANGGIRLEVRGVIDSYRESSV